MLKDDLTKVFESAKDHGVNVAVEVTLPGREVNEIIVVKPANLDYKLDYYMRAYNDSLELKTNSAIKIVGAETFKTVIGALIN